MSIVSEWLATELAALDQAEFPQVDLGYGTDLGCITDIDSRGSSVSGVDSVVQDAIHKLMTFALPGDEPEDEEWGIDLQMYLSRALKQSEIAQLSSQIQTMMLWDERLAECTVALTTDSQQRIIYITVDGELKDSATSFEFVFQLKDSSAIVKVVNV